MDTLEMNGIFLCGSFKRLGTGQVRGEPPEEAE